MSIGVIINPGSGPIQGAPGEVLVRHAVANMRAFRRDIGLPHAKFWRHGRIENGRYPFRLGWLKREVEIEMPGLALERVRYLNVPGQNIWHFPRLYVAGSSWVWMFAMTEALDQLGLDAEAEAIRQKRDRA